jgi:hypothetical protein
MRRKPEQEISSNLISLFLGAHGVLAAKGFLFLIGVYRRSSAAEF